MTKKVKIILVTLIVAVAAACAGVGFALWSVTLNDEAHFTLTAGQPVDIVFGEGGSDLTGKPLTPGVTVEAVVKIKCSGKNLDVTYKIGKVEMKNDDNTYTDITKKNVIVLSETLGGSTISQNESEVTFKFALANNVPTSYVGKEFRVTVQALGQISNNQ